MLSELGIESNAQELLDKMDTDGNGTISFDEFYNGFGALLEQQQKETKQVCITNLSCS